MWFGRKGSHGNQTSIEALQIEACFDFLSEWPTYSSNYLVLLCGVHTCTYMYISVCAFVGVLECMAHACMCVDLRVCVSRASKLASAYMTLPF